MRSFPRTGCRRASAAVAAVAVGVGLLSVLTGPSANAGELRDRQEAVHKKIAKADHELEESSTALRRATQALSHAREQLTEARAELGDVRARLEIARQRDEEMKAALSAAEARLEQARADVATGKDALQTQRDAVVDTITSLYQQGDPDLMAFTAILNSQTPSDITRQREANRSLVELQGNEYDDLHAAEVLLKVHEDEVESATAEVAERRQEAADHLVAMQGLTQEALDAKERVKSLVGSRKDAEAMAFEAKQKDRAALRKLKKQEARIQKLIQEAIRKARERARRKAARAAAKANQGNGPPIDTNGLLMHPVNGPGHLVVRLPRAPDLPLLGPARRRRLRRPLRRPAVRGARRQGAHRVLLLGVGKPPLPQRGHGQRQLHHRHLQPPVALQRRGGGDGGPGRRGRVRRHHRLVDRLPPALHGDGERQAC